jgi:hypothetical protein
MILGVKVIRDWKNETRRRSADEIVPLGEGIRRSRVYRVRLDELPDRSPGDDPVLPIEQASQGERRRYKGGRACLG